MPELPDVCVYLEALAKRVVGQTLERAAISSPFVLRTYDPPITEAIGKKVVGTRRIGKRLVLELDGGVFMVIHLMVAGRLHWRGPRGKRKPRGVIASFEFASGTLYFTEAGTRKRASLTMVRGEEALRALDPGGIEPLEATFETFSQVIVGTNHTLKRALTDAHLLSGIGNAYSDEILHAARLSPLKLTRSLTGEETLRLYRAVRETLASWRDILRAETGERFPENVTAFREGMAVHGRFKRPCPECGSPVQRIVYAENECNYCATCQTGGRLLADRSLSRLLKADWPKTLDEL